MDPQRVPRKLMYGNPGGGRKGGRPKLHWLKETYVPWGVTVEETYSGQRGMEKAVGRGHGSSWTGAPVL